MLKQHAELAMRIGRAEEWARALYERGCFLDAVVDSLRAAREEVEGRIRHYEAEERKAAATSTGAAEVKAAAAATSTGAGEIKAAATATSTGAGEVRAAAGTQAGLKEAGPGERGKGRTTSPERQEETPTKIATKGATKG